MTDPTPPRRRSPMEHERDEGAGSTEAYHGERTMTDAPERIWLQDDGDYEAARNSMAGTDTGVTWCDTLINDNDTEYLRADLVPRWSDDMDAAPKDGTFFLVYSPDAADPEWNDPGIRASRWEAGRWQGFPWTAKGPYVVTHWMPLLAPPKEGE